MEARKFRTGDRVRQKSGGPVMEVVKYCMEHELMGDVFSLHDVKCVWYDEDKNRFVKVFDQRSLYKLEKDHGLFTTREGVKSGSP